ncbi:MAG: hypothetical protein AB7S26_20770 [Sandaracinaceae bacterium]
MSSSRSLVAWSLVLVACFPHVVRAQDGDATCAAEGAEEHYQTAYVALTDGLAAPDGSRARLERFVAARRAFEAAFEACPNARYGFALAAALRQFGEYRASLSLFQRIVDGELPGGLLPEQQASLASVVDELSARVAELRIRVRGAPRATVRVNGSEVGPLPPRDALRLVVDPGRQLIDAFAPGFERAEATIAIESGERRNVLLTLQRPVTETNVFEEPWIWLGLGAAVAAAVVLILLFTIEEPTTESPLGTVRI